MKWKNGGGETFEIALSPEDSTLSHLNFDWRLSSATVASDGAFSQFPGYQRLLVIWQGRGLILNDVELPPFEVLQFSGNEEIEAKLIQNEIKDLGLIYHADKINPSMIVHEWEGTKELETKDDQFYFVVSGTLQTGPDIVQVGECLKLRDEKIKVRADGKAIVIEVSLKAV